MKGKNVTIYVIVCLLAIALIAWGFLIFYPKSQPVNKIADLQTTPAIPRAVNQNQTPTQTPAPNNNGQKIYQNEKLGVSFTYPSTWPEPIVTEKNIVGDNGYISFSEEAGLWRIDLGQFEKNLREGEGGYYWNIYAYAKKNYQQFKNTLKEDLGLYNIKEELTVNGNQAIIFTEGGMCGYKNAIIFGKSMTLVIASTCGGDDAKVGDKINDILTNLKF
jgi:hypothetical protein